MSQFIGTTWYCRDQYTWQCAKKTLSLSVNVKLNIFKIISCNVTMKRKKKALSLLFSRWLRKTKKKNHTTVFIMSITIVMYDGWMNVYEIKFRLFPLSNLPSHCYSNCLASFFSFFYSLYEIAFMVECKIDDANEHHFLCVFSPK
jgi:hypothetical protein